MDNSIIPQPWGSTSAQPLLGQPSRSRSGSSGSDASHTSSRSDVPLKPDIGAYSTQQPLASTTVRNGAASGSGRGRAIGGGGGRVSLEKGKGPQAPIAPGAAGQAAAQPKARRKRDGEGKRKKVAKACLVCQRSHLTCDEKRPCTRCVKKGIADQCVEGVRKKAKYLMEGETEEPPGMFLRLPVTEEEDHHPHHTASISPADSSTHRPPEQQSFALPLPTPPTIPPPTAAPRSNSNQLQSLPPQTLGNIGLQDDIWLAPQMMAGAPRADSPGARALGSTSAGGVDVGTTGVESGEGLWGDTSLNMFANPGYDFGTSASNEYQMLDSMLNSMSPVFPFDLPADNALSFDSLQQQQPHNPYLNPLQSDPSGIPMLNNQPDFSRSHSDPRQNYAPNAQQTLISPNWGMTNQAGSIRSNSNQNMGPNRNGSSSSIHLAAPPPPQNQGMGQMPWTGWTESPGEVETGRSRASGSAAGAGEMSAWAAAQAGAPKQTRMKTGADVYHSVVKPFDYTEGYHRLMEHISTNYQQKEVLRVVKALAVFRPSLIALQMPMSEEDEIFLERSFQRTLIELEKLISYSATPTAVWRRTGELVYANPEFCGLIRKQQDELLTGRTYIYQLFAKQSAISYWENFSVHAFENTTQNFFQATTLESGDVKLACSCCFTIRRDVFDLPSVIIGQFLPIPTDI